jgi:hypothetical protein
VFKSTFGDFILLKGGVDLRATYWYCGDCVLSLNHAKCVQLNISPEQIELMRQNITGFVPVINLPLLLGLKKVQGVYDPLAHENKHRDSLSVVKE